MPVNGADHRDWLASNHVFEDIALYRNLANFNLTGAGEPERLLGARISANLLPVLGVSPALGRGFTEDEDEIGNEQRRPAERRAVAPALRRRSVDRRQGDHAQRRAAHGRRRDGAGLPVSRPASSRPGRR